MHLPVVSSTSALRMAHRPSELSRTRADFALPQVARVLVSIWLASACWMGSRLPAQSVNTYQVNDGDNGVFDVVNNELAPDVGGQIPFSRYLSATHYYQSRWPIGGSIATFRDEMILNALDLRRLDQDIKTFVLPGSPGAYTILPFIEAPNPGYVAFLENNNQPIDATTWWNQSFRMWPYRLNGAPVLICIKTASLGGSLSNSTTPSIQLNNYASHYSGFGTNRNHTATTSFWFQEFRQPDPEAGWSPLTGTLNLGIEEQALAAGDIVVVCQSIFSENLWFDLQCTMAAEEFVRNQFIPTHLSGSYTTGLSFVNGGSWGGIVSALAALLQPNVYAASGSFTVSDFGYAAGDKQELDFFQWGALGMLPPSGILSEVFPQVLSTVDLLGIRFDGGTSAQWDLAAISTNRRLNDLKVKVYGNSKNEDPRFNGFWNVGDSTINTLFDVRMWRFMEHGAAWGVVPGKNEYSVERNDAWTSTVKNVQAYTFPNVDLIPKSNAPTGATPVYPDPYSHTLRHNTHAATSSAFLTQVDLGPAGHPNQPASIKTLGQGVWPGYRDSMRIVDVDGDGRPEVIFGNLDGYVHDLEFGNDANDPYRLTDQFKSDYLGRGIFASAGSGQGTATQGYFADSRGQVWKLSYSGGFNIPATPLVQPIWPGTYDGEVPYVFVGNFDSGSPLKEVLLLNRYLDWSLFRELDGVQVGNGRLQRNLHAVGPGQAAQCNIDLITSDLELLVPAQDGYVWLLNPSGGFSGASTFAPYISTFDASGPVSLARVDVANFLNGTVPSHLLVFGQNDTRPSSTPSTSPFVMRLYSTASTPPTLVGEGTTDGVAGEAFDYGMSFAWITPPANGATSAEFVVSGGLTLHKFTVTTGGAFSCTGTCTVVDFNPQFGNPNRITSIATTAIPGGGAANVVVALGNGRIFVLNPNLQFARLSDREAAGTASPAPWYSNRTLAQCMTTDLVQVGNNTDGDLYFADYSTAFRTPGGVNTYRLGRLHVPIGATAPAWVPYVSDIKNPAYEDQFRGANRTLLYRDIDGDTVREPRVFAETGTAYYDTTATPPVVREFCTYSYKADFNYDGSTFPYYGRVVKGGNVFEYFDQGGVNPPLYNYLGGFYVPYDTTVAFENFSGNDWWYPHHGPNRLTGQISNYSQSALSFHYGTSMKVAMLPVPEAPNPAPVPHVVVGTNGAYVYAIRPGSQPLSHGMCNSTLSYVSRCFGHTIIGMDVGNLDGDADDEIVVGEWIDTGSYSDWVASKGPGGPTDKNRAHLHILDPPASGAPPRTFGSIDLTGDDLLGAGNGIGAGVTGVRIDDVNNDGVKEIWCTDAIGHVYLFRKTSGNWSCFYRSTDLGACPGLYNQIYVMKNNAGKTTKVVMLSSGYVMAFTVDPSML